VEDHVRNRRFLLSANAVVVFLLAGALLPAAAQVTITDIGTINGRDSFGLGINHSGDVAGLSDLTGSIGAPNSPPPEVIVPHAIFYSAGELHDLGALDNPSCGSLSCQSQALGINDSDWIVGWSNGSSNLATVPVLWLPSTVPGGAPSINVLPSLTSTRNAAANAINNVGQIVGDSEPDVAGFQVRAVMWQLQAGVPTLADLGTLRPDNQGSGFALGINDLGQVVGQAADENFVQQAFLYLPSPAYGLPAGMNNLTPNIARGATAFAVNNRGEVVGAFDAGGTFPAFIWLPAAAYGLPAGFSILTLPHGVIAFNPFSISDDGQIVGDAFETFKTQTGTFLKRVATAWRNGRWVFLNDFLPGGSPWNLIEAKAVTHVGKTTRITGLGSRSDITDAFGFNPADHGYVLNVTCTGDLNDDGIVNQTDVNILLSQLGQTVPPGTGADLNGDGIVDQQDLLLLGPQVHQPCL
jgi:probable HAF family extracellular repeat protein